MAVSYASDIQIKEMFSQEFSGKSPDISYDIQKLLHILKSFGIYHEYRNSYYMAGQEFLFHTFCYGRNFKYLMSHNEIFKTIQIYGIDYVVDHILRKFRNLDNRENYYRKTPWEEDFINERAEVPIKRTYSVKGKSKLEKEINDWLSPVKKAIKSYINGESSSLV